MEFISQRKHARPLVGGDGSRFVGGEFADFLFAAIIAGAARRGECFAEIVGEKLSATFLRGGQFHHRRDAC